MEKEEVEKMKKLERLEKRVIYPNVQFYGAYKHNGQDIYLCNDVDEDYNEDGTQIVNRIAVECYIIKNVLYTNLKREYIIRGNQKVTEESKQSVEIKKDELLIYLKGQGFIIPEYKMVTIPDAIDLYNLIKGDEIDDNSVRSEEENS